MDLAFITPTTYLERYAALGDFHLALAHLIDDEGKNEYTRFYRLQSEQGKRVYLDNGLFEGNQVPTEDLLHRATLIQAHTVCAPDVLYDSSGTIKAFKEFVRAKQDRGLVFDIMGIPQASNPTDWWECFRFMELSRDCNIIGLSILSIPKSFNEFIGTTGITAARMWLIRQLYLYEILLGRRITKCHLLGLGDHLGDITLANRLLPDTIVSNDSSSAFVHGMRDIMYSKLGRIPGGKIKAKLDFAFDQDLTLEQLGAITHNIATALAIATYDWTVT